MRSSWKEIVDAVIGIGLLIGIIVGGAWLLGWSEGIFGPDQSGLFRR